jgi:hypothetical protein
LELLHISKSSLEAEMRMEFYVLSSKKKDCYINDVKEIVEKQILPNIFKLLQVALSIPISSATCERLFFSLPSANPMH